MYFFGEPVHAQHIGRAFSTFFRGCSLFFYYAAYEYTLAARADKIVTGCTDRAIPSDTPPCLFSPSAGTLRATVSPRARKCRYLRKISAVIQNL